MADRIDIINRIKSAIQDQNPALFNGVGNFELMNVITNAFADASVLQEEMILENMQILKNIVESNHYGSAAGIKRDLLNFQQGESLIWNSINGTYGYEIDDPDLKIIKQAAVNGSGGGRITVRYAGYDNDENLIPLTGTEAQVKEYVELLLSPGHVVTALTLDADLMDLNIRLFSTGQISQSELQESIESALIDLAKAFEFNGILLVNDILQLIRSIEGVSDCQIIQMKMTEQGGAETIVERDYICESGYFNLQTLNISEYVVV